MFSVAAPFPRLATQFASSHVCTGTEPRLADSNPTPDCYHPHVSLVEVGVKFNSAAVPFPMSRKLQDPLPCTCVQDNEKYTEHGEI